MVRFVNDAALTVLIVMACYWLGWAAVDLVRWVVRGRKR